MDQVAEVVRSPSFWVGVAALVVVIVVGFVVLKRTRRWVARMSATTSTPAETLEGYRRLHEQGELSAEEFDRIRQLMAGRLDRDRGPNPDEGEIRP